MNSRSTLEPGYVPCSTYRLQLNQRFTFSQAAAVVAYLHDLGITDCYTSPFLMAHPGSMHGYDVTDHTRFNPEIGSEEQFIEFAERLKQRGMGLVVDVVPNHMCITHPSNLWWWDVLENGPSSDYSHHFDIDWNPPKSELANKVLLPFLPDQFGLVLESQSIRALYDGGGFALDSFGTQFPLAPRSWSPLLERALLKAKEKLPDTDGHVLELESIITAISHLAPREVTDLARVRERQREKEVIRRRVAALVEDSDVVRTSLKEVLTVINGSKGDPHSFDSLEKLLDNQAYRLSFWRVASDEINYRRFFDINDLAAIRVESPEVFAIVHRIPFELMQKSLVSGIRIDHPDGLFDPLRYFEDLQTQAPLPNHVFANGSGARARRRVYLAAEKILVGDEELRPGWAIEGTTGYGFLNLLNGVYVDSSKARFFQRLYRKFTGWSQSYSDLIYESKRLVMQVSMSSELNVLSRRLDRISEQHRRSRDFTLESLRDALREVIACFPVYRTYIRTDTQHPDEQDERYIRGSIKTAKRRNPATSGSVFEFIQDLLLLKDPDSIGDADRAERRLFVMRFQQLTGPVMAKGLEDTAFYRYCPLLSLNEVGGSPDKFGVALAHFHGKNVARKHSWRNAMLASSTHDTKRSEDVRARINVLSEIPAEWYRAIRSWQRSNEEKKVQVAGEAVPSANEEYFLYQTLVGAWPLNPMDAAAHTDFVGRIHAYMEKALREAKVNTSWINPNTEYEAAFHTFLTAILDRTGKSFLELFTPFQARIARAGIFNSLSQALLKIAAPGLPDFYQGTEVWNFSLADPDNRRPVDYDQLQALLERLHASESEDPAVLVDRLVAEPADGSLKLYLTRCALRFRREHRALFAKGSYLPLRAAGEKNKHAIAFARSFRGTTVLVLAGRFFAQLGVDPRVPLGAKAWGDAEVVLRKQLPSGPYRDLFTGKTVSPVRRDNEVILPIAEAFSHLPIAMLVNVDGNSKGQADAE